MLKKKFRYFIVLLFLSGIIKSQEAKKIKDLKDFVANSKDDTIKVKKLIKLSYKLSNEDFKSAINYANQALDLSQKLNYVTGQASANSCLADAYWYHTDYENAQKYYFKSYRISDSIHNNKDIAFALYNLGWISCIQQHNYKNDYYLYKSYKLYQNLKDTSGLLKVYNALGNYYADRYINEDLEKYFDSSMMYFKKGIDLSQKMDYEREKAMFYGNLGDLFFAAKDYKSTLFYQNKSLELHNKNEDSASMMISLLNVSLCEIEINNVLPAIEKLNLIKKYGVNHDVKNLEAAAIKGLAQANYKLGKFNIAYDLFEEYIVFKEELDKETFSNSINNLQSSYSLEKAEANVEQLKQTNEIQELKNKKNTYFIFGLIAVALIVIIVAALLFKQNKQKQITNIQLKQQNHIIAEKKQEIDNSIQYAKGIQLAILPDTGELSQQFNQSFVYYKPKDVVSGDFYWFSKVEDDFYCIAADCTGHGVPGALMSIIGIDKIVQAIFEKKLSSPGMILSFLNKQIKKVLKQHSDESKQMDGMDIALLKFNTALTEVEFAGANRSLILIRNKELIEFKADKMAIAGFTAIDQEFVTTKVPLQKNDSLFIFTDGYADQFGGDIGKKFMSKNLKDLLVSVSELSSYEQEIKIGSAFNDWKKSYEQVDDVLIIGIKI